MQGGQGALLQPAQHRPARPMPKIRTMLTGITSESNSKPHGKYMPWETLPARKPGNDCGARLGQFPRQRKCYVLGIAEVLPDIDHTQPP